MPRRCIVRYRKSIFVLYIEQKSMKELCLWGGVGGVHILRNIRNEAS